MAPAQVVVEEGLTYGRGGDRPLRLDLYRPHDRRSWGARSGWLFIHGGGFSRGTRRQFRRQATHFAAHLDAVCACIEYRLSGEATFPAAVEDAKCAVRWLRAHAGDYGLHPERIGACGGSAGGNLAAMVGTTAGKGLFEGRGGHGDVSSAIQAMILFNPVLDLAYMAAHRHAVPLLTAYVGGSLDDRPEDFAAASPVSHVDGSAPPCLALHGTGDRSAPIEPSDRFVGLLRSHGVPARFFIAEGAGHGFFNDDPWYQRTLAPITEFAREFLGGPSSN